jgi:hypothetical protein
MRKLSSKLRAIQGLFLFNGLPALSLILFSVACHAQCYTGPLQIAPSTLTLSPTYWAPGQSYNVVIMDTAGGFVPYYPQPGYNKFTEYVLTAASYNSSNYSTEDPNVTTSNEAYVSANEITFNVSVAAGAPTENDAFRSCAPAGISSEARGISRLRHVPSLRQRQALPPCPQMYGRLDSKRRSRSRGPVLFQ